MITKFKKPVAASGSTIENEPIIKSDGASSDLMEWQASTGSSKVEIREDASNNLKLEVDGIPVASGLAGIDGQGLHFDGAAGSVGFTAPDLGTKFSCEFIVQADSWERYQILFGFGPLGELQLLSHSSTSYNLAFYDSDFRTFGSTGGLEDGKPHHIVITVDGTACVLYSDGNQVGTATLGGTPNIDASVSGAFGSDRSGSSQFWDGIFYRARFWNKTLSQAEVTASYENATVPFADQYGSQTNKITGAVDKNWGTAQADTGNDANDRATFNAAYVWTVSGSITDISIASNLLQFTTSAPQGLYYSAGIAAGKKYRITVATGTITGTTFKVYAGGEAAANEVGDLVASTTNTFEFTSSNPSNGYIYILAVGAGTIQLNAASVSTELVAAGVVADYDCAFSNPQMSLTVQDRAGAADGTSSATGVSQVTPIEQLNSKSARIGTSAATPADGELAIDGKVTISRANDSDVHLSMAQAEGTGRTYNLLSDDSGNFSVRDDATTRLLISSAGLVDVKAGLRISTAGQELQWVTGNTKITGSNTYMIFDVNSAERMRIDSTGAVVVNNAGGDAQIYLGGTSGSSRMYVARSGADSLLWNVDAGNLKLGTSDTARLTIDSTGNTLVQSATGPVFTSERDSGSGTTGASGALYLRNKTTGVMADGFGAEMQFRVTDADNTNVPLAAINATRQTDDTSGQLVFRTYKTGSGVDRLTIDEDGLATFANGIDVDSTGNFVKLEAYQNVSVADDATISLSSGSCSSAIVSVYETSGGVGGVFFITYSGTAVLIASSGSVAATDSDGNMCVYKSASSHTATFKNRMGGTKTFSIAQLGGYLV